MAVFRLQFLATYFSDQVVAGFSTGASIHVLVSQLKEVFYVRGMPKRSGFAQLFLVNKFTVSSAFLIKNKC